MDHRPAESLKTIAAGLAGLICEESTDQEKLTRLLQQLTVRPEPDVFAPSLETTDAGETPDTGSIPDAVVKPEKVIGIWKQRLEKNGSFFERDPQQHGYWHLWANVHRIYPKKNKKRIVLLGESVARGYFYDPYYTVANELEGILNTIPGIRPAEVVDLARTSMMIDPLTHLVRSCSVLEPDAVVIFAGNNWFVKLRELIGEEDYKKMYALCEQELFSEIKPFLERKFSKIIVSFLQEVQEHLSSRNIPVIFLIPGYNLKDWRSDSIGNNLPWLPGDNLSDWLDAKERAEKALSQKEFDKLADAAGQMIAIDAYNPLGHELLASAYIAEKRWEEARKCLSEGRDAMLVNRGGNNQPRCFGIVRDTILTEAHKYGIRAVDLPKIFNEMTGDGIPDRNQYLDYCHLTVGAIKSAMRYTAQAIVSLIGGKELSLPEIKASTKEPGNEIQAIAHFCAAIHNAHKDQSMDIVCYHCRKALSLSPSISRMMLQFADLATRHTSTLLCKAFEEIMAGQKMKQYESGLALRHPRGGKLMDIGLVDTIAGVLETIGINIKEDVKKLRIREHLIGERKINLTEPFYSSSAHHEFFTGEEKPLFLQARSATTSFSFIADGKSVLYFELNYRTPAGYSADKHLHISVNHKEELAQEPPMSKTWTTYPFRIGPDQLTEGVNTLTIRWPFLAAPIAPMGREITARTFLDVFLTVFGEIHSFLVVAGKCLLPENQEPSHQLSAEPF
ncbi:hypothetical protein ACX0G9_26205 [Flavitalea flava]